MINYNLLWNHVSCHAVILEFKNKYYNLSSHNPRPLNSRFKRWSKISKLEFMTIDQAKYIKYNSSLNKILKENK